LARTARLVATLAVLAATAVACAGCGSTGRGPRTATPAPTAAPRHATAPAPTEGIPAALLAEVRPIGVGPRFRPPAAGPVRGACRRDLGSRFPVHLELFAANRVVIVPAGIGTGSPRVLSGGGTLRARCYGDVVTLQPTGVVLVRGGAGLTLASVFRAWGQPLSSTRLADFRASPGTGVSVFVDGRRRYGPPGDVPLVDHSEIVLEVGPAVPPHASFTFPPVP
jgi:hypothetical protein